MFLLLIVDKSMAIEGIGGKLAIISPAGTGIGVVADLGSVLQNYDELKFGIGTNIGKLYLLGVTQGKL